MNDRSLKKGISDVPVESVKDDSFSIGSYVRGLSEFILICETPMTIAVQGDWGCGKTSLLNMVRESLGEDVKSIWFNTWQYSKFNLDDSLAISFLSRLSNALSGKDNIKTIDKLATLAKVGTRIGSYVVDILGAQKLAEDIGDIGNAFEKDSQGAIEAIENLKIDFQKAIDSIAQNEGRRVVVFIDDLDRLTPSKAVDLMEVLKLFLDCRNCVFVLAIDYEVVVNGIKDKYGEEFGADQGKKFFDKIIQVPFIVPVEQYDITEYIRKSLPDIVKKDEEDINQYKLMVQNSVGTNPRSMKRLFNTFLLLLTINKATSIETDPVEQKLLFAVLCLQLSMSSIYKVLIESIEDITEEFLAGLATKDNEILFLENVICVLKDGGTTVEKNNLNKMKDVLSISSSTNNEKIEKRGIGVLQDDKKIIKHITKTETQYNILTMGAEVHVGFGAQVTVLYDNKKYNVKMHNTAKGRVDGLKTFYTESGLRTGDEIEISYLYKDKTLLIKNLDGRI